jgi:tetratricopeptide (TPR) repeat protein
LVFLAWLAAGCSAVTSSNEAAWQAAPPPAGDRLQEGKAHFEQGNYGLAVAAYRASLRDNSSSVRALNGLAASYDRLGRFDLARRYYQRALEISPHSAQTLNNMGYSLILEARQNKGDAVLTAQARSYFQQASQSDGRHPSIAGNLAMLKSKPVSLTAPRDLRRPLLAMVEPDRYGAWVERRNKERRFLVTDPSKSLVSSPQYCRDFTDLANAQKRGGRAAGWCGVAGDVGPDQSACPYQSNGRGAAGRDSRRAQP